MCSLRAILKERARGLKMKREQWKNIPGYEKYQALNTGHVRRAVAGPTNAQKDHILSMYKSPDGYYSVTLRANNKSRTVSVHMAVLLAFKGPPPTTNHEGAHWDGNPSNNKLKNLRWSTHIENGNDMRRHGRNSQGSKNKSAKLTERQIPLIRRLQKQGWTLRSLGERFYVDLSTIHLVCNGQHWKHV